MSALSVRRTRGILALGLAGGAAAICLFLNAPGAQTAAAQNTNAVQGQAATARIVKAANAFLATLAPQQRKSVQFAFNDAAQRARWSNFPTGFVPRSGVKLGDLNPAQRSAALALLSSVLSRRGYEKVQQIMEADEILKRDDRGGPPPGGGGGRPGGPQDRNGPPPGGGPGGSGGGPGGPQDGNGPPPGGGPGGPGGPQDGNGPPPFGGGGPGGPRRGRGNGPRPGGGGAMFGKDLYYFSFLGTPSETAPWMLQFGGHHLALNITIVGAQGILTPSLTGAQPAVYTSGSKTVRPLGKESDKALALLNALDDAQKKQTILNYRVGDLVLGPGQDGRTIVPEGLKVSAMNAKQRAMLLDVIGEWTGIIHESAASSRMAEMKADLNATWFAWSGPTTVQPGRNITAYYRIQGPHLVIEYAPQGLGGDLSNHIHAMYRDPTNDYGRGLRAK